MTDWLSRPRWPSSWDMGFLSLEQFRMSTLLIPHPLVFSLSPSLTFSRCPYRHAQKQTCLFHSPLQIKRSEVRRTLSKPVTPGPEVIRYCHLLPCVTVFTRSWVSVVEQPTSSPKNIYYQACCAQIGSKLVLEPLPFCPATQNVPSQKVFID